MAKTNTKTGVNFRFIANEPALLVGNSLVIAELHIGYEQKLFPNTDVFFTQKLIDRAKALLQETHATHLIINGDVKHSTGDSTPEEQRELAKFFDAVAPACPKITIVKGNHDGGIERFVHNAEIVDGSGILLGDIGICHGNAWPSAEICANAKTLILAHTHPSVWLGGKQEQCWLIGRLNEKAKEKFKHWRTLKVIVMPAFSELVGGATLNRRTGRHSLLGPLFKNEMFKIDEAQVYLLNGVEVGRLRGIMNDSR
ncbi:MAG: metallophosphoesterase [Candidatus Micrarchaeia archaeon]|jgi:hypothetical protein